MSGPHEPAAGPDSTVARSSIAMAAGTVASRVLGVVRQSLIVVAIGQGLTANAFTTANTLPNIVYMLVAGGVLNSVLVPQLVRAMAAPDGGRDYTDRLVTLAVTGFVAVTVAATAAAGLLVRAYTDRLSGTALDLAVFFAAITIPQVFFYAMYALLGQVLNARGRFAAFGWSPAIANLVAIVGVLAFMRLYDGHLAPGEWTPQMVWWFAGTATASIVAQAAVLVWPLWRSGFRWRPRFGLRGVGLRATSRVAGWAFGALLVSQLGYLVASRVMWLASGGDTATDAAPFVAGVAVWANAMFVFIVPHSFVALSIVTAMYPRIAAAAHAGDRRALRRDYRRGLLVPAALTVPASAALVTFALPLTGLLYSSRNPAEVPATATVLAIMAPGVLAFGVDVLNQRVLYALEAGRIAFVEQCVLTVVAVAVTLTSLAFPPEWTTPIIAVGLVLSNVTAAAYGMLVLRRRIGRFGLGRVLRTWGRIALASAGAAYLAWGIVLVLTRVLPPGRWADLLVLVVGGVFFGTLYLVLARALRVREIAVLAAPIVNRLDRRSPGRHRGEDPS